MNKVKLITISTFLLVLFVITGKGVIAAPTDTPTPIPCEDTPIGCVVAPPAWQRWIDLCPGDSGEPLVCIMSTALRLVLIGAGLFALWKIISAGFTFMNAAGDPEKIKDARNKITLAVVGLVVIAASFVIMAIVGIIFFGDPLIFIAPTITGAP